jgi:hypothetical protein
MNPKLSLLVRENRGGKLFLTAGPTLEKLLSDKILSRLSLSETDRLLGLHKAAYKAALSGGPKSVRRFLSTGEAEKVNIFMRCFQMAVDETSVYYTPKQSEFIGALEVHFSTLPSVVKDLLEFDGDSLQLTGKDETNGLLIDWNKGEQIDHFELVVWGERWFEAAEACLRRTFSEA